jgi:hypothetical protein
MLAIAATTLPHVFRRHKRTPPNVSPVTINEMSSAATNLYT